MDSGGCCGRPDAGLSPEPNHRPSPASLPKARAQAPSRAEGRSEPLTAPSTGLSPLDAMGGEVSGVISSSGVSLAAVGLPRLGIAHQGIDDEQDPGSLLPRQRAERLPTVDHVLVLER